MDYKFKMPKITKRSTNASLMQTKGEKEKKDQQAQLIDKLNESRNGQGGSALHNYKDATLGLESQTVFSGEIQTLDGSKNKSGLSKDMPKKK